MVGIERNRFLEGVDGPEEFTTSSVDIAELIPCLRVHRLDLDTSLEIENRPIEISQGKVTEPKHREGPIVLDVKENHVFQKVDGPLMFATRKKPGGHLIQKADLLAMNLIQTLE